MKSKISVFDSVLNDCHFLVFVFFIGISFSSCHGFQESKKDNDSSLPSIVIFYADDLGWTDLGIQGSDFYQTPNIDQLAKQSLSFSNAYSNAPNCAPSRACLMTGLYPQRHGIYTVNSSARGKSKNRKIIPIKNKITLDKKFKVLPQSLKEVGYKTCMAGKWHLSDNPKEYGFDENFGGFHKGHPPSYFSPYKNPNLPDKLNGEYLPERLTKEVNGWLEKNKKEPFFLYFPFYLVHTPNQPKPELKEKYENLPKGETHQNPSYAAMVEAMDNSVGQVLQNLKKLGVEENTIIIFTSDNGPLGVNSLPKPLRGGKGMMYEGGIRVPFFIKFPKQKNRGEVSKVPIIGSDIYPTLFDLIGQKELMQPVDGQSFMKTLKNEKIKERPLFWHFPAYLQSTRRDHAMADSHDAPFFRTTPCSAVRFGNWKLIKYYEDNDIELFDLSKDIGESNNLANINVTKKNELLQVLEDWLKETDAPIPTEINSEYVPN